jgi:hypothetical protein
MYIPAWVILVAVAVFVLAYFSLYSAIGDVKKQLEELQLSVDSLTKDESEDYDN